jgi:hypothetical protein
MKSQLVKAVMKASPHLILQNKEVGTMLKITQHRNEEDNSVVFELEENGVIFRLESESMDGRYYGEGIKFMLSSPSFPDLSEVVSAAPEELRTMRELYDRLLALAKKGEL